MLSNIGSLVCFACHISIHSFWCIKAETRAVASVFDAAADSRWDTLPTRRVSANFPDGEHNEYG